MEEQYIEKLKNLSLKMRQLNKKFKLLSLLRSAKEEYDKNQFDDCIKSCEEALKNDPNNPIALRGLGCSMQSLGQFEEAKKYYKQALEYSKNKEIECTLLGTLYYLENNLEKAIEYYNMAIDFNENYDLAYEGKNQSMLENHLQICDLQDMLINQELKG